MMNKIKLLKLLIINAFLFFATPLSGWAQTTDYSGVYYIGSVGWNANNTSTNYYLCPTEGWAYYVSDVINDGVTGDDNGKPFLTTYQCRNGVYDNSKAVWIIEKDTNSNNYYIIQAKTGKYMLSNGAICNNPDRARIHLETIDFSYSYLYLVIYKYSINSNFIYY